MLSNNREEILNAPGSQGSRADVLGNNHLAADDSRIEGKTEWGKKKTVTDKKKEKKERKRKEWKEPRIMEPHRVPIRPGFHGVGCSTAKHCLARLTLDSELRPHGSAPEMGTPVPSICPLPFSFIDLPQLRSIRTSALLRVWSWSSLAKQGHFRECKAVPLIITMGPQV